jgi:hypothetical protein
MRWSKHSDRADLTHLDPGSLRAFVVEFTNHLAALSHTDLTVRGYEDADSGGEGRRMPTPNIDRLAAEGTTFFDFYV